MRSISTEKLYQRASTAYIRLRDTDTDKYGRTSGIPGAVNYLNLARSARIIVREAHHRRPKDVACFARKILYRETRDRVSISFKS